MTSEEAAAERRAAREQRQEQKLAKQAAREKVEHYYNGTKRGMASAILMFTLASNAHKDSNAMLWWAIIGLTEQYVGDEIDRSRYEDEVRAMCEEILRMRNGPTSDQTGAAITFEEDFCFVLMNHWTLSKSMCAPAPAARCRALECDTLNWLRAAPPPHPARSRPDMRGGAQVPLLLRCVQAWALARPHDKPAPHAACQNGVSSSRGRAKVRAHTLHPRLPASAAHRVGATR